MNSKLLLNILLLCLSFSLKSQIIYVKPNATGNGSSWSNARGDLRQVIQSAVYGTQIWVAKGTYFTTNCTTCSVTDRQLAFEIPDGVAIYGGFVGTETSLSQRNWEINTTILSGDIDGDGRATNNTYNIIYLQRASVTTIIDGFTITGGNADNSASIGERYTSGAAIYNDGRSGGFTSPTIKNCVFARNFSVGFGGAVFNNAGFSGFNEARFMNCQFTNNFSQSGGGAICNWGVFGGTCNAKFEFCRFTGNKTENSGGAAMNDGQIGMCEPSFINCQFYKNESTLYGGTIYNLGKSGNCTPTITGCLFWANKAFSAAGVYCLGSERGNSNPRITNCIFYKNEANTGGSVYANAGEGTDGRATGTAKPVLTNCIIWKNIAGTAPQLRDINGLPYISHSIVDVATCEKVHSGVGDGVTCGDGMLYNQDPLFNDPDNGDFHLVPGSPAINAGLNATITSQSVNFDLDSLSRIVGNAVDIGAWEFNPAAQFPPRILVSPESKTVCLGENTVLKTNVTGSLPLRFQWYKNNIAINNATTDILKLDNVALADSGVYKCIVRNELDKMAISDDAILKVKPVLPLSISINLTRTPTCKGDTATFKADIKNVGLNPKIEWQLNGTTVSTGSDTYTVPIESEFHKFTCKITSSEQCVLPNTLTSNELTVPVQTQVLPSIVLTAPVLASCVGDNIVFNTTIKNGGDTPQYQWYVNNILIDNRANSFQSTTLKDGDKVKAFLKSSSKCVTQSDVFSNELSVTLKSKTLVGVVMNANKTEICQGDSVVFTAIGTGGGATPQYEWLLNGTKLADKGSVLILKNLQNGDKLKSIFTSSETCTSKNQAESDLVTITVNDAFTPTATVTVSKSTICKGERVVFEVTGKNVGAAPKYQWLRNGKSLNWDLSGYATDSLRIDDVISVKVQSTNVCSTVKTIESNSLKPRVRICLYNQVYGDKQALIYPNPSSESNVYVGLVNLTGKVQIDVLTQNGQNIYRKTIDNVLDDKEASIEIPNLPDGLYIVRVINGDFTAYKKWMVAQ